MVGGFIHWDKLFEGSPSQDGKEVSERGAFAPVVEYDDGTHAFGLPGLITEPWQAMQRWLGGGAEENVARMRSGMPFTPEAAGDALTIAGSAALGGVASPKPAGAYVTSGAPMKPSHLPMDEASRMARAAEMGWDVEKTFYRGGRGFDDEMSDAVWLAETPEYASGFPVGYSQETAIAPIYARKGGKTLDLTKHEADTSFRPDDIKDMLGIRHDRADYELDTIDHPDFGFELHQALDLPSVQDHLRGPYSYVRINQHAPHGEGVGVLSLYGKNLRSKYAAFDPAKADSADLLAANPKEAAALNAAIQGERQAQKGITAYHGSPYDFDRFDMSKIGSGQGANTYGPGLYFAEAEDVAKAYRDELTRAVGDWKLNGQKTGTLDGRDVFNMPPAEQRVLATLTHERTPEDVRAYLDYRGDREGLAVVDEWLKSGALVPDRAGRLYEVRINAAPEDFLDWDKPFLEQPDSVQRAMRAAGQHPERSGPFGTQEMSDMSVGEMLRRALSDKNHLIHETMREDGVPGIKYLDQGSRSAGEGSRNYVVFDDKLIDIVKKYGIAGAASLYGLTQGEVEQALAEQGQGGFIVAPEATVE